MLRRRRWAAIATAAAGTLAIGAVGWTTLSGSSSATGRQRAAPATSLQAAVPVRIAEVAAPVAAAKAAPATAAAAAARTTSPPVSLVHNGVVVSVPVHPVQLLHDAQDAIRVTRKILKQFPHVKVLSVAPRQGGGFTVRVLLTPRQTGVITVDDNLHLGALIPDAARPGAPATP